MKLDRNSYGTVALVYALSAVVVSVLFIFVKVWWLDWGVALFLGWFCGWQTLFHIVPVRDKVGSDSIVSSVSDGLVVINELTYEKEYLGRECRMVSIYMDFWDVHANFWPVTGTVSYAKYHPGKHFLAFKPKASDENEHFCTAVRTVSGDEVFFKQIAGGFARRIVCYAEDGLDVTAGDQCGIIKFGSRIDYLLPVSADVKVKIGDKVRACETIIAELRKRD